MTPATRAFAAEIDAALDRLDVAALEHGVSPSQEGERRVVYTMEYVTSQEMGRVQRLYSDLKDAVAYFGIRALLRGRGRTRARRTRVNSES
jgi:hypothetical protein